VLFRSCFVPTQAQHSTATALLPLPPIRHLPTRPHIVAQVKAQAAAAVQEERALIWEEAHASGAQQAKVSPSHLV